jgi:PAS domain S-box-containing protein
LPNRTPPEEMQPVELGRVALRASEQRFRLLVESVSDYAIFMLEPDGKVATWNAGAERIKGYTADEIIGEHFSKFYPPEDTWKCAVELATARDVGRFEEEGWRLRKDGTRFWANVVITALREESGELVGYTKVTRDLTERKIAEQRERLSEERFRLLVESVKDYAIFMLDADGYVKTWNVGAERIKGYRSTEIIGQHFSKFYPREPDPQQRCAAELVMATSEGRFEEEGWRVRKDGSQFWANVIITALRDERGELVGFAKVTRDLTERRRAEQERVRLAKAEEANRTKDEFLATVSHELRTPLNAILGWSVLLAERVTDPSIAKPLATVRRNAEAQARLIDDVLDMSRIVTGKLRLERRANDLAGVVRDAIEVVRPAADAKSVRLESEGVEREVPIFGDSTRLQQVVWNLLTNAVKFTPTGRTVRVRVATEAKNIRVDVTDEGAGIAPDFLPHVFEPFKQADSSPTRKHGGLGLGLAIVRHIVELHGGEVRVSSPGLGHGTTFTVILPAPVSDGVGGLVTGTAESWRLDRVNILLVEDDEDARIVCEQALTMAGAEVRAVASVEEAKRAVLERLPDILVSDIGMPGEDGYELLTWMRGLDIERARALPALAVTAYTQPSDRMRARAVGFDDHLGKPFDPNDLVRRIHKLVRR